MFGYYARKFDTRYQPTSMMASSEVKISSRLPFRNVLGERSSRGDLWEPDRLRHKNISKGTDKWARGREIVFETDTSAAQSGNSRENRKIGIVSSLVQKWRDFEAHHKRFQKLLQFRFLRQGLYAKDGSKPKSTVSEMKEHSQGSSILNLRKGLMGKAEALLDRAKRDGKPLPQTWYYFATGYIGSGQLPKAIKAMKRAISKCQRSWKQPSTDILIACLEYLKKNKDVMEVEEFIRSLVFKDIVSAETEKELLEYSGISKEDRNSNKSSERELIVVGEVCEP